MYAWFFQDVNPRLCMVDLFQNPRCNLHEFWKMGGSNLHFRHVKSGNPLYGGPGTLVSDDPVSTFLFPLAGSLKGKMQYEWSPFTIAIDGAGKAKGSAWMGVHIALAGKVKLNIPKMKESLDVKRSGAGNSRRIRIAV